MANILPPADPRVENWPLMKDPTPVFVTVLLYLTFVLWLGPKIMKKHQTPFNLRPLMIVYNISLVLLSSWLVYEFAVSGWFTGYSLGCQSIDHSRRPIAMRMASTCWVFFISKIIELFDTVLFILRKKFELVSFLHVFHHAIMPISWWYGVKYVPGGLGTFHAFLNCIVHAFMYTYYGLAAAGPRFQKYIWWKKYLTAAQITQFIIVIFHSTYALSITDCNYPRFFSYWILASALIFLFLFSKFYYKAYEKPVHALNGSIVDNKYHNKAH